jgi:RNA polymerase sigma-70 factor (ECF subfamily)
MNPAPPTDTFSALRPRLFAIAYRMLGTRPDAEDVLQDAWLRWHRADQVALQSPEAWLVTVVTRLAIDRLRAAKIEREAYVGRWLPEPLVELDERTPEAAAELASELSVALLWVLERLAPEERAAYLLRQAFEHDYAEIAMLLGKSEAACRQMVHRAAERIRQDKPRFEVSRESHHRLLERFMQAAQAGDRETIKCLLATDAQLVSDGGGKVPSFPRGIFGADRIARLYGHAPKKAHGQILYRLARINGEPGLLRYIGGKLESAQAFAVSGAHIVSIYVVRNPDKLAGIPTPR